MAIVLATLLAALAPAIAAAPSVPLERWKPLTLFTVDFAPGVGSPRGGLIALEVSVLRPLHIGAALYLHPGFLQVFPGNDSGGRSLWAGWTFPLLDEHAAQGR